MDEISNNNNNNYDDSSIKMLKGADRIRTRPSTVLGSAGVDGAYHTVTEIIGNSMDEVRAGYGDRVVITLYKDGSISVEDNGRGVPMGWNEEEQRYNWDLVFNELYAGGKYDDENSNYEDSLGLNGLGATSTQYSSSFFTVVSKRDGKKYTKTFHKGIPDDMGEAIEEPNPDGSTGTFIHWKADDEVFTSTNITASMLKAPLESQAHLNMITVVFRDEETGEEVEYVGKGIVNLLTDKLGDSVIDVLEKSSKTKGVESGRKYRARVDVVLAITEETNSKYFHHHNTGVMKTGYHLEAFDAAVTAFFKAIGKKNDLVVQPSDYSDYLSGVTSTYANVNATSFKNQTKDGVDNQFIYDLVFNTVYNLLEEAHIMNKPCMATLIDNVLVAAQARKDAKDFEAKLRMAKSAVGKRREVSDKYVDCASKKPHEKELFIVEGNSAKGSCKKARDARFQALLSIKGKPLNCLKASLEDILKNEEVKSIINTVGTGIDIDGGDLFDIEKRDFDKIIFTTDADVDGLQIRVLLFTLFMRLMPKLLEGGYVYVAETPLFELTTSEGQKFAYSMEERHQIEKDCEARGVRILKKPQRSKGLGQNNPVMLSVSTMHPDTRRLVQLKIDTKNPNVREISEMLFGIDPGKERKNFITGMLEQGLGLDGLEVLVDTLNSLEEMETASLEASATEQAV